MFLLIKYAYIDFGNICVFRSSEKRYYFDFATILFFCKETGRSLWSLELRRNLPKLFVPFGCLLDLEP